jgi:hypothetical protein
VSPARARRNDRYSFFARHALMFDEKLAGPDCRLADRQRRMSLLQRRVKSAMTIRIKIVAVTKTRQGHTKTVQSMMLSEQAA